MRKNAITTLLTGLTLAAGLFSGGCSDESSILIDDQQQDGSSKKTTGKKDVKGDADTGVASEGKKAGDSGQADGKKDGVWGQVKGFVKGSSGEDNTKRSGDSAKKDTAPAADAAPAGDADDSKRWNDADEKLNDPDFEYAVKCIREQNYSQAKHLLLGVTARNPNSSSAWRWLGDCHYNLLELSAAVEAYQKALTIHHENYFALRGEAFAHLHLGHECWRAGTADKRKQAHEEYREAMKDLQDCLRVYPGDLEAMYGLSMAAEGASRRLYQNAVTQLKANNREVAEADARNCREVIDVGIEAARQRMYKNPEEIGPRSIAGGLFQRRATLQHSFRNYEEALENIGQAVKAYQSILEISPSNYLAKGELDRCQKLQDQWQKQKDSAPAGGE